MDRARRDLGAFGTPTHLFGDGGDSICISGPTIPMTGTAESLNLAVAAGVLIYQARRAALES